jgi:hypothetical protein
MLTDGARSAAEREPLRGCKLAEVDPLKPFS